MSDSLALARRLSSLDDEALTALLVRRHVAARDQHDFFDLADALLDPTSIQLALRSLDRSTLADLAAGSAPHTAAATLSELALGQATDATAEPRPYAAVAEVAARVLTEADGSAPGVSEPAGAGTVSTAADAMGSERAFVAMAAVAELGQQLRAAPLRLLARGGVPAGDEKRLGAVLGVDPQAVPDVVGIASAARLVAVEGDTLLSTSLADEWGRLPAAERWLALATAWLGSLPLPVQRALRAANTQNGDGTDAGGAADGDGGGGADAPGGWVSGSALRERYAWLFPASDAAMRAQLADVDRIATLLGLTADGQGTLFGRAALAATAAAVSALDAALPPEVDRVYVQHDLSVIAPGPLAPAVDARLRLLADIENRGVASSYRISQATIDRALASGETEPDLKGFLSEISLTGIPQALDYLLTEGGRRHGSVRVRRLADADAHAGAPRTLVHTRDRSLLAALAVDQTLAPLVLRATDAPGVDGDALASRSDPTTVYWSLVDARYPVLAEDAEGRPTVMRRARIADPPAARPTPPRDGSTATPAAPAAAPAPPEQSSPPDQSAPPAAPAPPTPPAIVDLVRRLRDSAARQSPADDSAWVARRLEQAVRSRTSVTIDVELPDGSTRRLDVTPLSLANGRLRCVDERAGVERTLPVANIRLVPAD